jgi:DNA-binding protein H-NS
MCIRDRYQIMHYKLEMTIAKSKGKIALMDINTIPNKQGWDEEKFFYYAEAMGFGLIDRNQAGTDKTWNQYQVLDMGLYEHIKNLIDVMEYVKAEWDQLVGITPQRKGQTSASETATGVSTARYQSALISERAFSRFEEFLQRELQAVVDYSKFSNMGTEKETFYRSDYSIEMLASTPEEFMEAEYGVYVSNTAQDIEDLSLLKQIIPNIATQDTNPGDLAEMIMSRNISKLKATLDEKETKEMDAAQQQQQSESDIQIRQQEIQKEYAAIKFEFDNLLQDNKYEHEKDLTHIKGQYDLADTNSPGDIDTVNPMDIEANMIKREEITSKTGIEREKIAAGREKVKADSESKKYVADTALKVAKENKNVHDTPKKKK